MGKYLRPAGPPAFKQTSRLGERAPGFYTNIASEKGGHPAFKQTLLLREKAPGIQTDVTFERETAPNH